VSGLLVNIDVEDLDKATRFYCAALDLRLGRRFEGAAELLGAAAPIYLLSKAPGTRATPGSDEKRRRVQRWKPQCKPTPGERSRCSPTRSATASACCSSPAAATTRLRSSAA
jgi:catechol 2,3-dioxygenase-like lactoylglutathione lyase family enzyme